MHGFYGKYLSIDLDKKTHSVETINDDVYNTYLGGKGLASHGRAPFLCRGPTSRRER